MKKKVDAISRCTGLVRKPVRRREKGSAKTHHTIIDALVVVVYVGSHRAGRRSRSLGAALICSCGRTSRTSRTSRSSRSHRVKWKFGRPFGFSREHETVLVRVYVPLAKNAKEFIFKVLSDSYGDLKSNFN